VRSLDTIQDPDTLRSFAVLLQKENDRLHRRMQELVREIAALRGHSEAGRLQLELEGLREQMAKMQRRLFAESSEKRPQVPETTPAEPPVHRGHGPREQPQLPVVELIHDLGADKRCCPACAGELMPMNGQFEESEEVTVVERSFVLVTHRRAKYRCRCNGAVVTAPGPDKLIPGGRYSVEFAVEVAAAKYLDHLPLERQSRQMAREGLLVDTQTLWNQIEALARHLLPSYEALRGKILESDLIHADETWWRLMQGKGSKRWWSWSISTEDAAHYQIVAQRSNQAAREVLGGYGGTVMADGYGVYESLARAGPSFVLANCWSHARRNFVEIEANYPHECAQVLSLIGELYGVERLAPRLKGLQGSERQEALEARTRLRNKYSRPIIDSIWQWASNQTGTPQSGLRKAVMYLLDRRGGLTRFLEDPRVPLDNNAAERALRGMVVGRKNHYGSRSLRGTQVAALFYSLLETAKLCEVEPKAYLRSAAVAAIREPGRAFLPAELKKNTLQ